MNRIILIDGNPLMWRAAYSQNENYVKEGIITYFFDILDKFDCSKCLCLWDSGKSRWRSVMYPEYKASRENRKNEFDLEVMHSQKEEAQTILSYFGVRNISVRGVEADDLISWFSEYFSKDHSVIIVSRDKDLWQLVNPKVSIFDPLSNIFMDEEDVFSEVGLEPSLIPSWKALTGDVSDNIKGVKGVGDKTAVRLLEQFGGIDQLLDPKNSKELKLKKTSAKILDQADELEHSYQLVKLPSLYDMHSFLDPLEKEELRSELSKEVVTNTLKAQVEVDLLQNYRIRRRFVDPLPPLDSFLEKIDFTISIPNDITSMENIVSTCTNCSMGKARNTFKLFPRGPINAKIMLLGKNLGIIPEVEDLLDSMFDTISIKRNNCWVTSVCKCSSGNTPVEYSALSTCSNYFKVEFENVPPKLIIALGNEAMSLTTPYRYGVLKHVGEVLKYNGVWVAVLPDPMYIIRDSRKKVDWDYGVSKIKEFLDERRKK